MSCGRGYECSECGLHFGGLYGFDRHRVNTTGRPGRDAEYDWRCASPAELQARGLQPGEWGLWIRVVEYPYPLASTVPHGGRGEA